MTTNCCSSLCRLFAAAIAVSAAGLTGCDTSNQQSGIEGTGILEGIAVATISRGPIERIDGTELVVNKVAWSMASAKTVIDGEDGSASELKAGMMATVHGQRTSPNRGTASLVETNLIVRGPIFEIDPTAHRVNVMGQTIVVDKSAAFHLPAASLAELSVGQIVAVSGFVGPEREVRATLLASSTDIAAADRLVNGAVTAVNAGVRRFSIGGLEIEYAAGLAAGLPSGAIEIGQLLAVSGREFTDDDALIATNIAPYDASLPPTAAETVLTSMVTEIDGGGFFVAIWGTLARQRIVPVAGAVISGRLTTGSYVQVTGWMSGGVLYASNVLALGSGPEFWLRGFIHDVDVASGTFTLLGNEFSVNALTRITDRDRRIFLEDLAVGDRVSVLAYENGFISAVDRHDYNGDLDNVEGEYFLELSPPFQFKLYGVVDWVVQVTPDTSFLYDWITTTAYGTGACDPISVSAQRFWELAAQPKPPGITYVQASGRFEAGILLADRVGICAPGAIPP
jgi:hypothetical protein